MSNSIPDYSHLQGKRVFITGGSRGIGEAAARLFVANGSNVLLCARSEDEVKRVALQINACENSGTAVPMCCDVADYAAVESATQYMVSEFGGLDILVNNAGVIEPIARFEDSDPVAWGHAFDINLKGVYNTMHAAFKELRASSGVIVNISSGAATSALEGWSHYCASKAAALALTRCAHEEWSAMGIRTIGLSPGTVATQMQTDIKKSAMNVVSTLDWEAHLSPEWVAKAIVWLTTDVAKEHDGTDVSLHNTEIRQAIGLSD